MQSKIQDSGVKSKKAFQDVKNQQLNVLQNNGASIHNKKFGGKTGNRLQTADAIIQKPTTVLWHNINEVEECSFINSGNDFNVFSPYSTEISTAEIDDIFNRGNIEPKAVDFDWNESANELDLVYSSLYIFEFKFTHFMKLQLLNIIFYSGSPDMTTNKFPSWNDCCEFIDSGQDLQLNSSLPEFDSTLSDDLPLPDFDWDI